MSVMGYRTLFEGSGIHHSNTGLQITHDMYINGYFMLLFDLTADHAASDSHTSLPENGNIRIELQFSRPLPEAITCVLYLEYDSTVLTNFSRKVTTDFEWKPGRFFVLYMTQHLSWMSSPLIYYRRRVLS